MARSEHEQLSKDFGAEEAAFQQCLEGWEIYFAVTPIKDISVDSMRTAAQELNDRWPYLGRYCLYSDADAIYHQELANGELGEEVRGPVSGLAGISQGLSVVSESEGDRPNIQHVALQRRNEQWISLTNRCIDEVFARFSTAAVVLPAVAVEHSLDMAKGESLISRTDQDQESDGSDIGLDDMSERMRSVFRSTAFRRLSRAKQVRMVDELIARADREYDLSFTPALVGADYCLRAAFTPEGGVYYERVLEVAFKGLCRGYASAERLKLDAKAIRRDVDMVDRDAGLCFIMEVRQPQETPELTSGEIILIPMSSQDPEISFLSGSDAHAWLAEEGPSGPERGGGELSNA